MIFWGGRYLIFCNTSHTIFLFFHVNVQIKFFSVFRQAGSAAGTTPPIESFYSTQ